MQMPWKPQEQVCQSKDRIRSEWTYTGVLHAGQIDVQHDAKSLQYTSRSIKAEYPNLCQVDGKNHQQWVGEGYINHLPAICIAGHVC